MKILFKNIIFKIQKELLFADSLQVCLYQYENHDIYNLLKKKENHGITHLGSVFSADIFCAEISVGKSQRLKEITMAVGKSKHKF
jgi:hypothetical protein